MKKFIFTILFLSLSCSLVFAGQGMVPGMGVKGYAAAGATNYTNDANMVSYYMMEQATGADAPDGKNANNLTHNSDGGGPTQNADHMQGSYSADFVPGDYEYYYLADPSLSAGFPGKTTGGSQGSFSVGCWFKPDASTSMGLIAKSRGGTTYSWELYFNNTNVLFIVSANGSSHYTITGATAITDDGSTWYHAVGVFNTDTDLLYVYVNGASDQTPVAYTSTVFLSDGNLTIGRGGTGSTMDGHIDECFVMSRVLSAAEVLEIYDHGLAGDR